MLFLYVHLSSDSVCRATLLFTLKKKNLSILILPSFSYLYVHSSPPFLMQSGLTALLWAADMGHLEVVDLLLEDGANLHLVDVVSHFIIYIFCDTVTKSSNTFSL